MADNTSDRLIGLVGMTFSYTPMLQRTPESFFCDVANLLVRRIKEDVLVYSVRVRPYWGPYSQVEFAPMLEFSGDTLEEALDKAYAEGRAQ